MWFEASSGMPGEAHPDGTKSIPDSPKCIADIVRNGSQDCF